eukprot:PLAT9147.1.p2 GENE.PLAT9147.1~~PLAT9147.1.p2  ORF type:complete len:711 (-),score=384.50 PLAT9147.1:1198-3330(-)
MLKPPGEFGADIVVGSTQRFGVPLGFGGPHAGFLSTRDALKRRMPGRLIGVSKDRVGEPALRMALQTREQHIRRDKATSNICTAQALLANMAAAYAIYHGPAGLRDIAARVHRSAAALGDGLRAAGYQLQHDSFFDTLVVDTTPAGRTADDVISAALSRGINLRRVDDSRVGVSMDETVTRADMDDLLASFGAEGDAEALAASAASMLPAELCRESDFLTHPIFNTHHSETQMLRYLYKLESRDLSLTTAMIPLGSCTMKLNATSEMIPVTWPEFGNMHPMAPPEQTGGYTEMMEQLSARLCEVTGFTAASLAPNSGAVGEYAGLNAIAQYHKTAGDSHRNKCLIPVSAHGTNAASAVLAGMQAVAVKTLDDGTIDMDDLKAKAEKHSDSLAAIMVTYPSTYGLFDSAIREVISTVHDHGGLAYLDGANMNAQVGLCRPGDYGADVCHLNLHKTFCIPHGGGGPGVGAIACVDRLAPYLPGHAVVATGGHGAGVVEKAELAVTAAPFGSAGILPITWMYMRMLGGEGLREATLLAVLNANYMAKRLEEHYDVLFRGPGGMCAHEFILDMRPFKAVGVTEEDIAKRLIDYGFHAPTMSWPVPGTLMIEPTESEDRAELDRFVDAMISIRGEIEQVASGELPADNNPLVMAPHTASMIADADWDSKYAYSRELAAYPTAHQRDRKFWPTVGRVDNVYGDRNLICSCVWEPEV